MLKPFNDATSEMSTADKLLQEEYSKIVSLSRSEPKANVSFVYGSGMNIVYD